MLTVQEIAARSDRILEEMERAVIGKREALALILLGFLSDGHVLIEDFPGLGKTLIARSFAQVLAMDFGRVQFTPDLMPSDVTGSSVFNQRTGDFRGFAPGPIFTNLLLGDEINRAPPKTQAALLEAMQERQVTIEGQTNLLERPFLVIATQNPIEYEGHILCRRRNSTDSFSGSAWGTPAGTTNGHYWNGGSSAGPMKSASLRSQTATGCWKCSCGPSPWPTCWHGRSMKGPLACWAPPRSTTRWASAASSATPPGGSSGSSRSATARPEEKAIREVNPSCYVFELPLLWDALDRLDTSNAQDEYYLTDAPERLMAMGRKVVALNVLQPDDILGVNTRQHLAQAADVMQARIQDHWMTEGVTIVDPHNTYIDGRATIGRDTVIYPFTRDLAATVQIGANCRVGPFTHLRDGTVLEDGVEVGAFVEIKRLPPRERDGRPPPRLPRQRLGRPRRQHRRGGHHGQLRRQSARTRREIGDRAGSAPGPSWSPRSTIGQRGRRRRRRGDHPGQGRRRRRHRRRRPRAIAGGAGRRPGLNGQMQEIARWTKAPSPTNGSRRPPRSITTVTRGNLVG